MAFLIHGQSKIGIGVDEVLVKCPSCEKDSWADLMVESQYFHIFWLPVIPVTKDANLICQECGLKRYGLSFSSRVIPTYEEIKQKFKHPIRTYFGLILIGSLILCGIIISAFK